MTMPIDEGALRTVLPEDADWLIATADRDGPQADFEPPLSQVDLFAHSPLPPQRDLFTEES
jgi:hypothetical protein